MLLDTKYFTLQLNRVKYNVLPKSYQYIVASLKLHSLRIDNLLIIIIIIVYWINSFVSSAGCPGETWRVQRTASPMLLLIAQLSMGSGLLLSDGWVHLSWGILSLGWWSHHLLGQLWRNLRRQWYPAKSQPGAFRITQEGFNHFHSLC